MTEENAGKIYTEKNWLYQKYVVEKLSVSEIAVLGGCNPWTIGYWLKKHDIPVLRRRTGEKIACKACGKLFYVRPCKVGKARYCSKSCASRMSKKKTNRVVLVCETCGVNFSVPKSLSNRRFCSKRCYGDWLKEQRLDMSSISKCKSRSERIEIKCKECGRQFYVSPSRKDAMFCSVSCKANWDSGKVRISKRKRVEIKCEVCKKTFEVASFRARNDNPRFCSKECRGKWHSKTFVGKNSSQWKGKQKQERHCENCGSVFTVSMSKRSIGYDRFCSKGCQSQWQKENRLGELSGNWRGGLSFEPYPFTFNEKFKCMIRERDNYSCIICGCEGKDVHHVNYVKNNTRQDNCVVLCRSCHSKTNAQREYWPGFIQGLVFEKEALNSLGL